MKNKDKKRENSIDEAISPPFPQVQCISIAPETELQKGEEWEERGKERSGTTEGRCLRKKINTRKIEFNGASVLPRWNIAQALNTGVDTLFYSPQFAGENVHFKKKKVWPNNYNASYSSELGNTGSKWLHEAVKWSATHSKKYNIAQK